MGIDKQSYVQRGLEDFLGEAGFSGTVSRLKKVRGNTDVMSTVGLTGDESGFLILSMNNANAFKLTRDFSRLMGIPIKSDQLSDTHIEALSELSNQIAGRVVMFMEKHNLNCSITPPTVISGGSVSINLKPLKRTEFFKIKGSFGYFYITIGIR